MAIPMKRTLLIKNVYGACLLDTTKANVEFTLEPVEERWEITVHGVSPDLADIVQEQLNELNLFYFEEDSEKQSIQKWWIYDKQCPIYSSDSPRGVLSLIFDSRVAYSNERV
jgi:hypothetical protein